MLIAVLAWAGVLLVVAAVIRGLGYRWARWRHYAGNCAMCGIYALVFGPLGVLCFWLGTRLQAHAEVALVYLLAGACWFGAVVFWAGAFVMGLRALFTGKGVDDETKQPARGGGQKAEKT